MDDPNQYNKPDEDDDGDMMFGEEFPASLLDSDEERNIFDDEFDAANDETFGGGLDNIGENVELENYSAQTARLRLDDPVWQNPSSSDIVAPDASEIPLPFPMYRQGEVNDTFNAKPSFGVDSPFLKKSIWGNATDNSFNIWGSDFGMSSGATGSLDIDYSSFLGTAPAEAQPKAEAKPSTIPAMPTSAMTLEDFEKMHFANAADAITDSLSNMQLNSAPVQTQQKPAPPVPQVAPQAPPPFAAGGPLPIPSTALSLEELEAKMLQESQKSTAQAARPAPPPQQPSPPDRFSYPPPGFHPNMQNRVVPTPPAQAPQMSPAIGPGPQMPHGVGPIAPQMAVMGMPMGPQMGFPPQMMMPPGLPKLPPLNPQFLPFIPIWLNAIIGNLPLPPGVPPPPPFLFQLLNHYRNPQMVHAMIVNSSVPPQFRPNGMPPFGQPQGPHSPGIRNQHRKNTGMPSTRTIYDLALDSFAGYMSFKEREWLIRIQFVQCKGSGDAYIDDFYYLMWREKQIANGYKALPKVEKPKSSETQKDYMERIRRMNYREMQKERARERDKERQKERKARAERGETKKPRQTLSDKFASSLGLPSKSSTHNPRHVLDMKQQVESNEHAQAKKMTDEERKIAVAKKLRTMLLRLEGALTFLIEIDELRKPEVSEKSQFKGLSAEEKEQEVVKRTSLIIDELMGDDLAKLMQMSKGRAVITRTLKVVGPKEQARIILALMTSGALVSKKMYGEIVSEILPIAFQKIVGLHPDQFKFLVHALALDSLKRQLLDSNVFIRDMMLTLFYVSNKNHQELLEWSKATKFPSLKLPSSAPLNTWRKALSVIPDNEILEFAEEIKYSGIIDCHELAELIQNSL